MALLDPNMSLWVVTTPRTSYPQLSGTHDADVVVVGAGITGLTTALRSPVFRWWWWKLIGWPRVQRVTPRRR
jgi:hypothetical protein